MQIKNILITGGAGFIGSHINYLLGLKPEEYKVTIIDNLSTGRKESILSGDFIQEDLANELALIEIFSRQKFDAVIHMASSIVMSESIQKPLEYYDNNVANSLILLKLCKRFAIKNFIFSSTAAVYGTKDKNPLCSEADIPAPTTPYGRSKLMTEWMLEDFSRLHRDFNFITLRYFNVAGASLSGRIGQCGKTPTHLLKIAAQCAAGLRDKMYIYGTNYPTPDGTCIRDYLHVDDLAQAHILALSYLFKGGKSDTFNCGYGHGFSVREIIQAVKKISGTSFEVQEAEPREGDANGLIADATKIRKILGWTPQYDDLNTIIETALAWEKTLSKE
jgi:UDP-glucose 4-epimerase